MNRAHVVAGLVVILTLLPATGRAHEAGEHGGGHGHIGFDQPEAWAMKYFASVSLPSSFDSPPPLEAGDVELAIEYIDVPTLSDDERRVGFDGEKLEDLNKTSYVVRPTARVGLGSKFSLEAGWVPPVDRNGVEANIVSLALGRPLHEGDGWRLGLRLHGLVGNVKGDITCDRDTVAAGEDPERNPFDCEEVSKDEYHMQTLGLELSAAWQLGRSDRWEPFVAISVNRMNLEFQVNAVYEGTEDHGKLDTDGQTVYLVAGLGYDFSNHWRLAGEAFYTPLDVVRPPATSTQNDELLNLRAQLRYSF